MRGMPVASVSTIAKNAPPNATSTRSWRVPIFTDFRRGVDKRWNVRHRDERPRDARHPVRSAARVLARCLLASRRSEALARRQRREKRSASARARSSSRRSSRGRSSRDTRPRSSAAMPACACGDSGSVRNAAVMSACPRGGSTSGATKSIRILSKPVTLMRQRSTMRAWKAFDDKAERLTSNVSIDGLDEADHRARLTRSPQGTIRVHFGESRDRRRAASWLVVCTLSGCQRFRRTTMGNRHWRLLLIGVLCIGFLSSTLASAQGVRHGV